MLPHGVRCGSWWYQHAAELLPPHQQREEALLFPVAADAGMGEAVAALHVEHHAIGAALARLAEFDAEAPELEAPLDSLGQLLDVHVRGSTTRCALWSAPAS